MSISVYNVIGLAVYFEVTPFATVECFCSSHDRGMQRTEASTAVCRVVWKSRHVARPGLPATANVFMQTEGNKKQVGQPSSVTALRLINYTATVTCRLM